MEKKKQGVRFGRVDIAKSHFLLSHSEKPADQWHPIGVLSIADSIENMRLALLVHDIKFKLNIEKMKSEIEFYLYELKNPNPASYLIAHCSMLGNVYSEIHFTYIENINKNNILYYTKTKAKLLGTWDTVSVAGLHERYLDLTIGFLFDNVLNKEKQYQTSNELYFIFDIIFRQLPKLNGFEISNTLNLIEFSKLLASLGVDEFCNILIYLKKVKLIKIKDITRMLDFYYLNKKEYQDLERINS